jgi:hypothetical protein
LSGAAWLVWLAQTGRRRAPADVTAALTTGVFATEGAENIAPVGTFAADWIRNHTRDAEGDGRRRAKNDRQKDEAAAKSSSPKGRFLAFGRRIFLPLIFCHSYLLRESFRFVYRDAPCKIPC